MAFTQNWDTDFGNSPADSESRRYGAQRIRNFKDAVTERAQVDHEWGEEVAASGVDDQEDTGYHKRVTLKKVAGGPSEAVAGYAELGYNSTSNELEVYPEGGAKRVIGGPPIGSIIGVHPDVDTAKVIDTNHWKACDGVGTFVFTYPDGTTSGSINTPDLTDNRFLMGGTASGTGGSNTIVDHTHTFSLTAAGQDGGAHTHTYTRYNSLTGADGSGYPSLWNGTTTANTGSTTHTHNDSAVSGTIGTGSAPTSTDSRPLYFTVEYYIRIK
jgi:hypothetical protein